MNYILWTPLKYAFFDDFLSGTLLFPNCQCGLLISAFPQADLPLSQKLRQIVNVFESHQPITSH